MRRKYQIKFKNYCVSFIVSCPETSASRHVFVSSPFLTPSICPADLLLVAMVIFLASPSSWYSQPHSPCLALLPLVSLFSLPFSFSADPSLLPRGLLSLHPSFPEPFSTKTSRCSLTEPVSYPWGVNADTYPPMLTAGQSEHLWGLPSPAPPGTNTNAQLTQMVV